MNDYQKLKEKRMSLNDFELKLILLGLTLAGFVGLVTEYLGFAFTLVCTGVLLFSLFCRTAWPIYKDLKVRLNIYKIKKAKKLLKKYPQQEQQVKPTITPKVLPQKTSTPPNLEEKEIGSFSSSSSTMKKELSVDPDLIDKKVEPQFDLIKKN